MATPTNPRRRGQRIPDWLREPGPQVVRADHLMVETLAVKADVDALLETLDEDNIPVIKACWDAAYMRFIPMGVGDTALVQALIGMGREYIKIEVVGDPVLKRKWLLEEEMQETLPREED